MEHERFKELAALAAGGQLSGPEYAEFRSHIAVCTACRQDYSEYQEILYNQFPIVNLVNEVPVKSAGFLATARAYERRFLARARAEGIPLPTEPAVSQRLWRMWRAAAAPRAAYAYVVVLMICGFAGLLGYRLHESRLRELANTKAKQHLQDQVEQLHTENSSLEARISELSKTSGLASTELSSAKAKYGALTARYEAMETELKRTSARVEALRTETQSELEKEEGLSEKLKEAEASLANVTEQYQNLRKAHANEVAGVNERLSQLRELEGQLGEARQSLDRATRLLAADRDIHDLMGARSLHMTDVFDVDSKGKTERAFGRVFYTEGRSLIFYAFDLKRARKGPHDRAYQVWGYHEAAERSVQSLGMLYLDDQKQNRWALKFDDPSVLAEIDTVFVTIEPPGGSEKPTGKQLLYAYLGSPPNHP
jgi:archaellum component FlaC